MPNLWVYYDTMVEGRFLLARGLSKECVKWATLQNSINRVRLPRKAFSS
jgi:hypothetical protein